jgi:hypothetical protein
MKVIYGIPLKYEERELFYSDGINPIVSLTGQEIVLRGQKSLLEDDMSCLIDKNEDLLNQKN